MTGKAARSKSASGGLLRYEGFKSDTSRLAVSRVSSGLAKVEKGSAIHAAGAFQSDAGGVLSAAAATKARNNGWGLLGRDLNSGWNCTPT